MAPAAAARRAGVVDRVADLAEARVPSNRNLHLRQTNPCRTISLAGRCEPGASVKPKQNISCG